MATLNDVTIYECLKCGELVKDGDDCCDPTTFQGLECEGCGQLYPADERSEAEACCPDGCL